MLMIQSFRNEYPALWRKIDILCHGISEDEDGILERIYHAQNPGETKRTGNAGLQVKLENKTLALNVAVYKKFSQKSPYKFLNEQTIIDQRNSEEIPVYCPTTPPNWYSATVGGNRLASHLVLLEGDFTAITSVTQGCIYFNSGQQCQFCAIGKDIDAKSDPYSKLRDERKNQLKNALILAAQDPNIRNIHLTGGNTYSDDRGAQQYYDYIKCIKVANPHQLIAIEIPPPKTNCQRAVFEKIKMLGADSITINIEFWDDDVRRGLMPIKGAILRDEYVAAFQTALEVFGKNKVSCGFIIGVEPLAKTKEGAKELAEMGIIVEVYPFKPNDNSDMENHEICSTDTIIEISLHVDELMKEYDIHPDQTSGCVKCGACGITQQLAMIQI